MTTRQKPTAYVEVAGSPGWSEDCPPYEVADVYIGYTEDDKQKVDTLEFKGRVYEDEEIEQSAREYVTERYGADVQIEWM